MIDSSLLIRKLENHAIETKIHRTCVGREKSKVPKNPKGNTAHGETIYRGFFRKRDVAFLGIGAILNRLTLGYLVNVVSGRIPSGAESLENKKASSILQQLEKNDFDRNSGCQQKLAILVYIALYHTNIHK